MITLLAGGTGAAKFLRGLAKVHPEEDISIIVNTGDDFVHFGLYVSPDVDTILYCLAGVLSKERGWGIEGDTFRCNSRLGQMGMENWFMLGDLDLATHLFRTRRLSQGSTLSEVTRELCSIYGIKAGVLPMSDATVETRLATEDGELAFQEYYVKLQYRPKVIEVRYAGAETAEPSPGVLSAIEEAEAVIIAPSNPVTSIGPILSTGGVRDALRKAKGKRLALSPFVGGEAVSGPATVLMGTWGMEPNPGGLAQVYSQLIDYMIIDEVDRRWKRQVEGSGIKAFVAETIMKGPEEEVALARQTLRFLEA